MEQDTTSFRTNSPFFPLFGLVFQISFLKRRENSGSNVNDCRKKKKTNKTAYKNQTDQKTAMASFSIENEHLSYVNRKQILQKNVPNTQLYMDSNKMANRYKNHRLGDKELLILCTVLHHVICQRLAREFFPLHKPTFLDPPATWHRWHNPTICLMNCVYKELICFCLVTTRWKFDYNSLRRIKRVSLEITIPVSLAKIKLNKFSAPRQLIHQATPSKTIVLVTCLQIC